MRLDDFGHDSDLPQRLSLAGLSAGEAVRKAELFTTTAALLREKLDAHDRNSNRLSAFFVPGRIEVLGKHTDYAGGSSIVAAAERGLCLVVRPRSDNHIAIHDVVLGESIQFPFSKNLILKRGHWSNYSKTVAYRLARNFPGIHNGVDIAMASDLPSAAGMSSSSAFIVGVYLALNAANDFSSRPQFPAAMEDPLELAGYLATVENGQSFRDLRGDRGVGTFGGSEDHTAILCAEPGCLSQFAYCPTRFQEAFAVPNGHCFAIAVSGVVAEKTGAARELYNRASRLVSVLVGLWNRETGDTATSVAEILGKSAARVKQLNNIIVHSTLTEFSSEELRTRLHHFLEENEQIIPAAGKALQGGNLAELGQVVDASQLAAEELLGNQIPETSHLAASARRLGAVASSAFGAGFGGSVWALVATEACDDFLGRWANEYGCVFPQHTKTAEFFRSIPGPAAFSVK